MSTYTQIMYHIVFGTRNRRNTMVANGRDQLFKYITGIVKNKKCHLYIINGVEDHLHILTHLHPEVSLAGLVKDIKLASTAYIRTDRIFPAFEGWQSGYGAFTCSFKDKDRLIRYIANQEEHHRIRTFREEYQELLMEQGITFDERYLM
jgi:putative transposase